MGKLHNNTLSHYNGTNDRKEKIEQTIHADTHTNPVFLSLSCDELCIPHAVHCATHRQVHTE